MIDDLVSNCTPDKPCACGKGIADKNVMCNSFSTVNAYVSCVSGAVT